MEQHWLVHLSQPVPMFLTALTQADDVGVPWLSAPLHIPGHRHILPCPGEGTVLAKRKTQSPSLPSISLKGHGQHELAGSQPSSQQAGDWCHQTDVTSSTDSWRDVPPQGLICPLQEP